MAENLLALAVKPLDVATPLLQARRIQQAEVETQQAGFNMRQAALGSEARGLAPYVNHPEFGQRWAQAIDRLAQAGHMDPQQAANVRNTPSPLALQQLLAQTSSMEQFVKMQELEQSRQASSIAERAVAGITGAQPQPSAAPVPRVTPPTPPQIAPTPQNPLGRTGGAVQPSATMWGDQEAIDAGLYDPPAGVSAGVPLPRPRPGSAPQAEPGSRIAPIGTEPVPRPDLTTNVISPSMTNPANRDLNMLTAVAMQRNLPEGQRNVLVKLIDKAINDSSLTPEEKQYFNTYVKQEVAAGRKPLVFDEWVRRLKREEAGESSYDKQMGEIFANYNKDSIKSAADARSQISNLSRMNQLLSNPNVYTGTGGQFVASLKRLGASMGIDTSGIRDGASNAEAINSISNQMALQLRNPSGGAGMPGALSDQDRNFLQSMIAGLANTPGGNKLIVDYMSRVAQRSIDVERLRQRYVLKNGRLDEGFFRELDSWSAANPLFSERDIKQAESVGGRGSAGGRTGSGVTWQSMGP